MQLETKHVIWIFDAALEKFVSSIEEFETELARHEHCKNLEYVNARSATVTREQRIQELLQYLEQYKMIAKFCKEAKLMAMERSAEEFARDFKFIFQRK